MTIQDCWKQLCAMVPTDTNVHVAIELDRYPPDVRRMGHRDELEITAWGSRNGETHHVEAETCEELVERFRVVVLPALGVGPEKRSAADRLADMDCEVA